MCAQHVLALSQKHGSFQAPCCLYPDLMCRARDSGARMRSTRLTVTVHPATRMPLENACSPRSGRLAVLEAGERSQSPTYRCILHPNVHGTYISDSFDTRSNESATAIAISEDSL